MMKLKSLCEYMTSPVGLETAAPLFSWSYEGEAAAPQKSYRVLVADSLEALSEGNCWDSGAVEDASARKIFYAGTPLVTAGTYFWKVETTLSDGTVLSSDPDKFMMGLMGAEWRAMWVGGAVVDASCYWYRKDFVLSKPVKKAAAFVTTPCYCELSLNGKKADDTLLNNVHADYTKSTYYATYDITAHLNEKENALGLVVGFGWHNLREAEDGVGWGDNFFSLQVLFEYEDGTSEWLVSDLNGWKYTVEGPLLYNSIYNGEVYDARKEMPGWDCYGYEKAHEWKDVIEREELTGVLRSQYLEPIRVVEEMEPKEIIALPDGSYTLDFGQNYAGWVRMKIEGEKGQKIVLRPAELMHPDGSVNTVTLRRAHPEDVYILKGEGVETYEPRFTYHGFRYMQVFGLTEPPKDGMFTGCVVRSAVKRVGGFSADDPIVDKLYSNIVWTEASNLHGIPTDCPQRDERLGWLNDMTVRNECALYNYRLFQLYAKWMRDIRDTQGKKTGAITDTAPFRRYGIRPADPVSTSFLLIPWNLYLHYGDKRIIEENYDALKRWVAYLKRNSNDYIMRYCTMGDWAAPIHGTDPNSSGGGAISKITPTVLMGTGYFYYDCLLLEKMANVLGKEDDAAFYKEQAAVIKEAFGKEFFHEEEGYYAHNSQASNIFPLYLGLVPEEKREAVLKNLCEDIRVTHHGHLTTGNLCSRYGMEVLFLNGEEDLAWHLLTQTDYPGWGYMIKNGATTVWERWEKVDAPGPLDPMASHNHPMNGAVGVCFHKYLAGIRPVEEAPGFEKILFRPIIPTKANEITASLETVRGTVRSEWKKEGNTLFWEIEVPLGSTAEVSLPIKGRDKESLSVVSEAITVKGTAVTALKEGVTFLGKEEDYLGISLGGGVYRFAISG